MIRLLYLVSHPIQYQAPLLRRIAAEPGIRLRVIFGSVATARHFRDPGFGVDVAWDVPLLEGYDSAAVADVDLAAEMDASDAVWVHGWQYRWQRQAVFAAARRGRPVMMRGENWSGAMPDPAAPFGWMKRLWLRRLFRQCSAFLAIGSKNREYYLAHGVPAERIHSMPYAVDNAFFAQKAEQALADRDAVLRHLGIPGDRPILLFAGKLTPRKRPDMLLALWQRHAWPGPRPALVFVGDGELRKDLERRASGAAYFLGFRNQSELPALYGLADLVVVPSEREPWGLVVNEAMACGTAVVASDAVGAAYDLIDPTCGAVFRSGDIADLERALLKALPRAKGLGVAARRRIAAWDFEADIRGLRTALAAAVPAADARR